MTHLSFSSARRLVSMCALLAFVACSPPDRRDEDDNGSDASVSCGNGTVDSGETCDKGIASGPGSCPTSCDDGVACTTDTLQGSADACSATCVHAPVTACVAGDGCCAAGCTRATDADCSATCGNGTLESGETCDKAIASGEGSCPTSCDDGDACTSDVASGSVEGCSAACTHANITACASGDGCCAPGCNATNDSDCAPRCGNGVVEAGETCDGNCPSTCNDGVPCTEDHLDGDPAKCTASCTHSAISTCASGDACCPGGCNANSDHDCVPDCGNAVVEAGELCDGNCPTSCADGDVCTTDTLTGSFLTCNAACSHAPVTSCVSGDGCCPSGCSASQDSDCGPRCGDGIVNGNELCDGNCPTSCNDGDSCTTDALVGSAATCDARCTSTRITQCVSGDGCCVPSCGAADSDCAQSGPLAADACAAPTLVQPGTYRGLSLDGYADDLNGSSGNSCKSSHGADGFFRIDVPAGKLLTVVVTPTSSTFDPVLSFFPVGTCSNVSCSASRDRGFTGDPETLAWFNSGTTTASMEIWIDEYQPGPPRTFDLSVSLADPAPGETCAGAVLVNASGTLSGQTFSATAPATAHGNTCSTSVSDQRRVYAVDVPPGMHAEFTATGDASTDLALDLIAGTALDCQNGTSCTTTSDAFGSAVSETVGWTNASAQTQRIYVVASSYSSGTFSLTLALAQPIPGDNCGNALTIGGAATLSAQSFASALNDFGTTGYCGGTSGPDRVWVTNVPAGQRLTVTARSSTAAAPKVTLVPGNADACASGSPVCVQQEPPGSQVGATMVARWTNPGAGAIPTYIRVDGATGASYDLTTAFDVPAAGETCVNATPLAIPSTVSGTTVGATDDYAASGTDPSSRCAALASGDRVYAASVPPGKTLVTVLKPEAGFDATLNLIVGSAGACDGSPRVCASSSDSGTAGGTEAVRYTNNGSAAQPVLLLVDATSVGGAGAFSLSVTTDLPPGDTCGTAVSLSLPASLPTETLAGYGADVSIPASCTGYNEHGTDRVYALTVPPGKTLTVNVTPLASDLDPALELLPANVAGCANVTSCLAGVDKNASGQPEVLTYANNSTSPSAVFLVVSHFGLVSPSSAGSFSLNASLSP